MFIYSCTPQKYSHMSGIILLCDLYREHFDEYQARLFPWYMERMGECVQPKYLNTILFSRGKYHNPKISFSPKFQRITNGLMRSFNFVKMWNHQFCTLESYNGMLYLCQAHTSNVSCYTILMLYYKYREVERVCGNVLSRFTRQCPFTLIMEIILHSNFAILSAKNLTWTICCVVQIAT